MAIVIALRVCRHGVSEPLVAHSPPLMYRLLSELCHVRRSAARTRRVKECTAYCIADVTVLSYVGVGDATCKTMRVCMFMYARM